jgi:peptidoglycan/LPS O-acetylase OafA/YrhL
LSYGMYIFAFPVQQVLAQWGQGRGWGLGVSFGLSLALTGAFAYVSWHLVEKRALLFKPSARGNA